jgi:peptidyl-prolyl cis-trans isomerase A (cyclophilin A)
LTTTAPQSTAANSGSNNFYDNLDFFRIINGFMGQAGSPSNNGLGGSGSGGASQDLADEYNAHLTFDAPYYLAMANSGANTNDSQFFITTEPYSYGNFSYSIIGYLTEGGSVMNAIQQVPVTVSPSNTSETSAPVTPVVMSNVQVFNNPNNSSLFLTAPAGTTAGTYAVSVTATAANGSTAAATINVAVAANSSGSAPPTVLNFSTSVAANSQVSFTTAQFTSEFSDPNSASLTYVEITSLPTEGTLSYGGTAVAIGQMVAAADLSSLVYTPSSTFTTGADTFGWNGYDGTNFANSAAIVTIEMQ